MLRRFFQTPIDDAPDDVDATTSSAVGPGSSGEPDLAALPIVGITRRRAAILLGALLAGWIIILFARQVSEASAATGRAETLVANAPTLPPDAPGSAGSRVGARNSGTPLESWLTLLFGPGH